MTRRTRKAAARATMKLVLFVAGASPNSVAAIANLQALRAGALAGRSELEIVDVFEHAERASAEGVLVTPTLLRLEPAPKCRIVGNLSNTELVLRTLTHAGKASSL